jgi:predicted SnoaL-like aldol condensation-catalyzing enzyme
MSEPNRTARQVAELYTSSVWNEHNFDLADELIADTMIRHQVGEAHVLTRREARQEIEGAWAVVDKIRYSLHLVIADDDGEHVAVVYDAMLSSNGNDGQIAGIEVYRIIDGQIAEIWTCGDKPGLWL